MSDIDFLANKKGEDKEEAKEIKKQEIVWSEPKDKTPVSKSEPFFALSFLGKKKSLVPKMKKERIKKSRQEILNLIKNSESQKKEEIKKESENPLKVFFEKFKKKPHHEILLDYQRALNHGNPPRVLSEPKVQQKNLKIKEPKKEKIIPVPAAPKPALKALPPLNKKPEYGENREKKTGASFFSKFFKKKEILNHVKEIKIMEKAPPPLKPASISYGIKPQINVQKAAIPEPPMKKEESAPKEAAPKVLETNLIQGEIIAFFEWRKKITALIGAIFLPVIILTLAYYGLGYYQKYNLTQIEKQNEEVKSLDEKIKQAEGDFNEIAAFQARLKAVFQIFSKHIYWTNFFKFLEDNTIANVYYGGFTGDTSGKYSLEATARSFSDISSQANAFKDNESVIEVKSDGGEFFSGDEKNKPGVKFNLDFKILSSIFTE